VLLFTDWTLLRLFPPLRAMWAAIGTQAKVAITGQNARRVLFGTINVRTARRTIYIGRNAGAHEVRAFLLALRKAYRRAARSGFWPTEPADIPQRRRSRWPRHFGSNLSGCRGSGRS
jgi:hypothetical protein